MADSHKEIRGMPQLLSALDKMARDLPKETQKAAERIARDWIGAAKGRASGPTAKEAAGTLHIGFTTEGAQIAASHPGFYGEEFGGRSRPETMMFPPHQGQRGYFLFPAARANADKFNRIWEAAVDDATKPWDHKE